MNSKIFLDCFFVIHLFICPDYVEKWNHGTYFRLLWLIPAVAWSHWFEHKIAPKVPEDFRKRSFMRNVKRKFRSKTQPFFFVFV